MALLPTGLKRRSSYPQEECCPEQDELNFDYDSPLEFLNEVSLPQGNVGEDTVSLESGLSLLDQVQCLASNSSVPSPFSDSSSDSGVLGSATSTEEEVFLAGLFGSDFPLMQNAPLDMSSPTPSPPDWSTLSPVELPSQQEPSKLGKGKAMNGTAPKTDSLAERNRKSAAEAARQNRIKKKKYVEDLEKERSSLKRDNVVLKTKCHEYQSKCQRLQSEVNYLKNVLANDSILSSLIQNIPDTPGVNLTSSFRKRPSPHSIQPGAVKRQKAGTGGICLHVAKDVVSLEFCENCSKLASS